jgi:hypothetical protein
VLLGAAASKKARFSTILPIPVTTVAAGGVIISHHKLVLLVPSVTAWIPIVRAVDIRRSGSKKLVNPGFILGMIVPV